MKKNVASQNVSAVLINNADGSNFSGTCTVYVQGDASAQALGSVGSGVATSMGNGQYRYAPAQAETNYDQVNFIFTGSGAGTEQVSFDTTFPQTGDAFARLGAPVGASTSADIAAVQTSATAINAKTTNLPAAPASTSNITSGTITTVTNLTNAPTSGDLTAAMKTSVTTAATAATPTVTAGTVSDKTGYALSTGGIDALFTRSIAESYAADGAAMTVAQALYLIAQTVGEFSIAGTTITVKKLDGSTTAATYTLDSSTAPSSRTRAS